MAITAQQAQIIKRCQSSVVWFLRNFGKLRHPSAGVLPFNPFSYQRKAIKAFRQNRLNCFRKCRQSGVSKVSGAFATWFGMFHSNKTILIVSRKNDDAMAFLRDHIVFLFEHLPKWMRDLWAPVKQTEHEIAFPNGSRIQSLTSHPDVLRSHASSLNIIDEAAFIQNMDTLWAGGWPCTRLDTLIQTNDGLVKIGDIASGGNPWVDHNIQVATDDGYQSSDKAYMSGCKPTIVIDSNLGFQLEGTHHHRIRTIGSNGDYSWRELSAFVPGDILVSLPGQFTGKRRQLHNGIELSPDLAEIIGLYIGDGSLSRNSPKRFKIVFDPQDVVTRDIIVAKFNQLPLGLPTRAYAERELTTENLRLNSSEFIELMVVNRLDSKTKPQNAQIPELILKSDEIVLCAFLRGLFDSDGWCYQSSTSLKLGLSTTSEKLAEQVHVALHSLGIIARRYLVDPKQMSNQGRYSDQPYWRIDIWDADSKLRFRQKIGFITARKQACLLSFKECSEHASIKHPVLVHEFVAAVLHKMMPKSFRACADIRKWNLYRIRKIGEVRISLVRELAAEFGLTDRLSTYVNKGLFFDTVGKLTNNYTDTADISVPTNNTYLANGLVSHNTLQHGGNVIVISTCVAPDTYVWTENGMCQIKDLAPEKYDGFDDGYYHANYVGPRILGTNGLEMPSKFYKRPKEKTRKLHLSGGYHLEASNIHKLPIIDQITGQSEIKFFSKLHVGDILPIKHGQMIFGNSDRVNYRDRDRRCTKNPRYFTVDEITPELAYLLGVIVAEGYVREQQVIISCGDKAVLDACCSWNNLYWKRGRKGQDYVAICGKPMLVRFLKFLGVKLVRAPLKEIPARILSCSEPVIRNFLRGLFDGDGCAAKRRGEVCLASTSKILIEQVRQLLFNYGVMCRLETKKPGTTTFKNKDGTTRTSNTKESYKLVVASNYTEIYYNKIGFGLARKQRRVNTKQASNWSILMPPVAISLLKRLKDSTDLSIATMAKLGLAPNVLFGRHSLTKLRLQRFIDKLGSKYSDNEYYIKLTELLYYDDFLEIRDIEESESEVYDFTMPQTHTFIGNCIINMNCNGVGNWYWSTMTDAEAGFSPFNPITINWWDMDWVIEYIDPLSKTKKRIAPRDGIRRCTTKEEITKYGPYWSPWLEEQWRALQEQGEAWKFEQEILASFIGSGNTVLTKSVISHVQTTVCDPEMKVAGYQTYVHPVSGMAEEIDFDFTEPDEGLWIWAKPIEAKPDKKKGDEIIERGSKAHTYVMGVDIATGKGRDYSAIEVFDIDTMEQVAEFMARCLPRDLLKFIDRIGRWYNCALAVVERNNGGDTLIDSMRYDIMYPRIWRKKNINDTPRPPGRKTRQRALKVRPYGFATSPASKPTLNKFLIDCIRDTDDDGYKIYSKRLLKQIQTYVRKRDRSGRDTNRTEAEEGAGNFDDLVIAAGLALLGTSDALLSDEAGLAPYGGKNNFKQQTGPIIMSDEQVVIAQKKFIEKGGASLLMPVAMAPAELPEISAQRQLDQYTMQLGAIPVGRGGPLITPPKYFYERQK